MRRKQQGFVIGVGMLGALPGGALYASGQLDAALMLVGLALILLGLASALTRRQVARKPIEQTAPARTRRR